MTHSSPAELSLDLATLILKTATEKAGSLGVQVNIAVVDAGPNLKGFIRMDGALLGAIDVALKKARTACLFETETGGIGELSQPGGPLYNIEHSNGGLISFPGGVPLKSPDGVVIGAIGVSGSTVENDRAVALAGAAASAPGP
ncbi:heme-binding protein [Roseimicrobium sp. ORNL1]|uniref:GlcG/HbpS family heme-binding protein n=1 Tax=Roseimicrobium sp. ORNL1 TaxID=2711231 RepID=UPI0013E20882|nr:heme-binding protein [Roseimicrobium sp. ORNL1]QIF02271.1 heme-binding protein [Roseimicrobium sp. ORNL1]